MDGLKEILAKVDGLTEDQSKALTTGLETAIAAVVKTEVGKVEKQRDDAVQRADRLKQEKADAAKEAADLKAEAEKANTAKLSATEQADKRVENLTKQLEAMKVNMEKTAADAKSVSRKGVIDSLHGAIKFDADRIRPEASRVLLATALEGIEDLTPGSAEVDAILATFAEQNKGLILSGSKGGGGTSSGDQQGRGGMGAGAKVTLDEAALLTKIKAAAASGDMKQMEAAQAELNRYSEADKNGTLVKA